MNWTKNYIKQLSYNIVGCAIKVHKELGPGLLESIYEECLRYELEWNGFVVTSQELVPIKYRELKLNAN